MCGIFGANDFKQFEILYSRNKDRGTFSHGFLFTSRDGSMYIRKGEGEYNLTGEYVWRTTTEYGTFLGHTQAPTSSEREFHVTTSHPFEYGHFIVAHNGILENHNKISQEMFKEDVIVDSQIIPRMLDSMYVGDDVFAITEVCNKLEGIFACWIYSKHTGQTYLVRNGSTLYTDKDMQVFSSVTTNKATECLDEGKIYCMSPEGLTITGRFDSNTAFFM